MESSGPERVREIAFRHSRQFVPILQHLGASLLVSTYAAGKLVCIGTAPRKADGSADDADRLDEESTAGDRTLTLDFVNFRRAMGIAQDGQRMALGGPQGIWWLRDAAEMTPRIEPAGELDRAFLSTRFQVTGNIHVHELGFDDEGELWLCNTLFSCLCTLSEEYHFVPRWRPPFISSLAPEDRCHLNGIAWESGRIVAATAMGQTDQARGWRDRKATDGVVLDVPSGAVIHHGFCMPHSPRIHPSHPGKMWVLDSGRGALVQIDRATGQAQEVVTYPGYGRGLALTDQFAFIGMSKARETSVFGGVPICEDRDAMRCGIVVVDLTTGKQVAFLEFESGVDEIFDVSILPHCRRVGVVGPTPKEDGRSPIWVIPPLP